MPELTISRDDLTVLAENVLQGGNMLRFRAMGGSMYPFVRNGDILEIEPLHGGQVRLFDIILYKTGDQRLLAHRVVGINHQQKTPEIILQGDALLLKDLPIPTDQVLGRVIAIQRNGKIIRMDSSFQRLLACLWVGMEPIRPILFRLKARLGNFHLGSPQI
jgi:signal peptidase I